MRYGAVWFSGASAIYPFFPGACPTATFLLLRMMLRHLLCSRL